MKEREITLDYFKLVMSFLVITIHLCSYNDLQEFVKTGGLLTLNRIAVPCFFLLNGYFLQDKLKDNGYLKSYLKKIIVFILVWNLIYLYKVPMPIFNIYEKIMVLFLGSYHLWYLSALFIGVLLFYFLQKYIKNFKILIVISFLCFLSGYLIQYQLSKDTVISFFEPYLIRNGLFFGLPFLILGNIIGRRQNIEISNKKLYILLFILLLLFILEINISKNIAYSLDFYISVYFLAPVLFLVVLKNKKTSLSDGYISSLSQGIYFIHPLMILLVVSGLQLDYYDGISALYLLPLVIFLTMVVSAGVIELNKRIKIFI